MSTTVTPSPRKQLWGIYYTDREYARELGDPLRTVIEAGGIVLHSMFKTGHALPLRAEGFCVRESVAVNPQISHAI